MRRVRAVARPPAPLALAAFALAVLVVATAPLAAQARPVPARPTIPSPAQESRVNARATGPFDVQLAPLPAYAADAGEAADGGAAAGGPLGRMSIDKRFHGDLEATSRGEMLSAITAVKGSAAYSAVERVSGTLGGRRGSFVLQHTGVMHRGAQQLTITVVPDSGTGELAGLTGTMQIRIEGGQHSYSFDYTLPAEAPAAGAPAPHAGPGSAS